MSYPFPIVGPIAPETNPPINPQYYAPRVFQISNITNGKTTLVTTSVNHDFVIGQQIRLHVGPTYGCRQFNGQSAYVLSIPEPNQVQINIDSTLYDTFVDSGQSTPPQIASIGDVNTGYNNTQGITPLPQVSGAFMDIYNQY